MQVLEELVVSKGKRTKRQRLPSPPRLATPSASCNNAGTTTSYNNSGGLDLAISLTNSPTTTTIDQLRDRTEEEEEDMANCLILLAQGHHMTSHTPAPRHHNNNNNNNKKSGLYLYECKTCNRCFPSSQALGGHRASHSKLNHKANGNGNGNGTEEKHAVTAFVNHDHGGDPTTNTILSLQIPNTATFSATTATTKKSKFHECSICGAEFSSGQALGGHMRRHRNLVSTSTTTSTVSGGNVMGGGGGGGSPKSQEANYKKPRNVLKLDLNLPAAPEDDQRESSKFSFQPRDNVVIAFSARSSLVDCHY